MRDLVASSLGLQAARRAEQEMKKCWVVRETSQSRNRDKVDSGGEAEIAERELGQTW